MSEQKPCAKCGAAKVKQARILAYDAADVGWIVFKAL